MEGRVWAGGEERTWPGSTAVSVEWRDGGLEPPACSCLPLPSDLGERFIVSAQGWGCPGEYRAVGGSQTPPRLDTMLYPLPGCFGSENSTTEPPVPDFRIFCQKQLLLSFNEMFCFLPLVLSRFLVVRSVMWRTTGRFPALGW